MQNITRNFTTTLLFATLATAPVLCAAQTDIIITAASPEFRTASGLGVSILKYHGIDSDCGTELYSPEIFDEHIAILRKNNFETIDNEHLVSWIRTGAPALPAKPFMIAFDDNYASVYTVGYPVLKKYGYSGVNYAPTKYVGIMTQWPHCSWSEIMEMEREQVIYTESHSVTHPLTPDITTEQKKYEVEESKVQMQANMPGKVCRYFTSPGDCKGDDITSMVIAAGYEAGFEGGPAVVRRDAFPFRIPRVTVDPIPGFPASAVLEIAERGPGTERWKTAVGTNDNGTTFAYATAPAGDGTDNASWQWTPAETERCTVAVRLPKTAGATATDAMYTVRHKDGISTVTIDMKNATDEWTPLGKFDFAKGKPAYVAINNKANGTVAAEALRVKSSGE